MLSERKVNTVQARRVQGARGISAPVQLRQARKCKSSEGKVPVQRDIRKFFNSTHNSSLNKKVTDDFNCPSNFSELPNGRIIARIESFEANQHQYKED